MATQLQNLSSYNPDTVPDGKKFKIGIVVAEWNLDITSSLCEGAIQKLTKHGVLEENIKVEFVPGSFELTLGAQYMAEYSNVDAILCLGCVIQGETRHFDFICQGVTEGITQLNLKYNIPFIFGLLTTNNLQQAKDRAGGKHGNKGDEAAITALKMLALNEKMR